jgi:hypothetical protein
MLAVVAATGVHGPGFLAEPCTELRSLNQPPNERTQA